MTAPDRPTDASPAEASSARASAVSPGLEAESGTRQAGRRTSTAPAGSAHLYDIASNDPESRLVDRSRVSEEDLAQISAVMQALGTLRDTENRLMDASLEYMKLGHNDMRALHFLIVSENRDVVVTPGAIAAHLHVSSASTTKLLDRLERAGHITRSPHPSDRRALAIRITPETRHTAMETVGRQQARRFAAAARLTPDQRAVVIDFLTTMARELADDSSRDGVPASGDNRSGDTDPAAARSGDTDARSGDTGALSDADDPTTRDAATTGDNTSTGHDASTGGGTARDLGAGAGT